MSTLNTKGSILGRLRAKGLLSHLPVSKPKPEKNNIDMEVIMLNGVNDVLNWNNVTGEELQYSVYSTLREVGLHFWFYYPKNGPKVFVVSTEPREPEIPEVTPCQQKNVEARDGQE